MAMLVASAALAKAGGLGFVRLSASGDVTTTCPTPSPSPSPSESPSPSPSPSPSESPSASPSPSESPSSDQGDQNEQGDQDEQGTSDEQESSDQGDQDQQGTDEHQSGDCKKPEKDSKKQPPVSNADRAKACMEAAGMSPDATTNSGSPQVKTTGLDHAIETVLANCIKNPQAPGLLNALKHLVANRDRHAAHDADKAARRAAHDAAKAEHQASKGHGH